MPAGETPADAASDLFATRPIALDLPAAEPVPEERAEQQAAQVAAPIDEAASEPGPLEDDEQIKRVGDLRIGIPLFNIYLNEADELSRRLGTELAEWAMELHRPVGESAAALAHSLAGSSATVGFADLSQLARALEHALLRSDSRGHGDADEAQLYVDVAEDIRRLLHQFAAGFLKTPRPGSARAARRARGRGRSPAAGAWRSAACRARAAARQMRCRPNRATASSQWVRRPANASRRRAGSGRSGLGELRPLADLPEPASALPRDDVDDGDEVIEAIDAVDAELFPIFEEEGRELLPQLATRLRDWAERPA